MRAYPLLDQTAEHIVRRWLRKEFSAYKVRGQFVFFAEGGLPFTDSGKIDKRSLIPLIVDRIAAESAAA